MYFHSFFQNTGDDETETTESIVPSETQELLQALKTKAEAFSDKEWLQYWQMEGPSLLIGGWKTIHPDIPLSKIHELGSLEFVSATLEHLTLKTEHQSPSQFNDPSAHDENTNSDDIAPTSYRTVSNVYTNSSGVDSSEGMEDQLKDDSGDGDGESSFLSDEDILRMWNEHYNSYYWYCYHLHRQQYQEHQLQYESVPGDYGDRGGQDTSLEVCLVHDFCLILKCLSLAFSLLFQGVSHNFEDTIEEADCSNPANAMDIVCENTSAAVLNDCNGCCNGGCLSDNRKEEGSADEELQQNIASTTSQDVDGDPIAEDNDGEREQQGEKIVEKSVDHVDELIDDEQGVSVSVSEVEESTTMVENESVPAVQTDVGSSAFGEGKGSEAYRRQ